ncbi:hypothetical protein PVK06_035622 [Gossypium arboreum]|uniref:Uncharacterized protein n=1 Tax=Gossypium arboreum TaxID=29729 RepID=A0ABR0NHU2_GOSAR|nr:hypothetical protein PVK06_035622 [Gossypium arboreum]
MARIRQVAEALNWELFCEKRPSVDEELTRKFCESNLKRVDRSSSSQNHLNTINEFFELPDFENDDYSSLMNNIELENLQEILEELTILGSKWTMSRQGIHTCRREYLTPLAKQRVQENEDPEEEEDTTMQPAEVPNKAKPMEPEADPDVETSMFRPQPPSPDLQDELSKLMDIMKHM